MRMCALLFLESPVKFSRIDAEHFSARHDGQAYRLFAITDAARGLMRLFNLRGPSRYLRLASSQLVPALEKLEAQADLAGELHR